MIDWIAVGLAVNRAKSFSGWDFAGLPVSYPEGREPWDYVAQARELITGARRVVDLGTGGGERLSEIVEGFSGGMTATEQWVVNAPVARRRLRPLGIPVVRADSLRLPFARAAIDVVLSRHEELEPAEVDRVLKPGGVLLTQQVFDNWPELRPFFPRMTTFEPHEVTYRAWFEAHGYDVTFRAHHYPVLMPVPSLAYMLTVDPGIIPGFDPEEDAAALVELERTRGTDGGILLSEGRYILHAQKPA